MDNKENSAANENTAYLSMNQTESNNTNNTVYSLNDTTILDETLCESDDDNFEELERMCNKTLSDPNNTIHKYIARQKLKREQSGREDTETRIIDRLLKQIDNNSNESKTCLADQTQLNDIEEPSCLWENTITGDTSTFQVSPEKALGFVRLEPILEESLTESMDGAVSFKTAQRYLETTSSEQYETASETMAGELLSDDVFCAENVLKKEHLSGNENDVELIDLDGHATASTSWNYENTKKESSSLLDETLKISPSIQHKMDYNLIDLDMSVHNVGSVHAKVTKEHSEVDAIILLSDDEDETQDEGDSHNTGFSLHLDNTDDDIDAEQMNFSGEFDDTLDEINYIMKQGIKYLAENPTTPKVIEHLKPAITPSPISSPPTPNTVITKPKKLASHEKPGLELFKKPQVFSRIPQSRTLIAVKKPSQFQHVVSPVGAYIKNTPKTPITTELKHTQDVFQSKAVRGLDYSNECSSTKKEPPIKESGISLPKKAYISSEYKHVVDQRKQISIPGGEKIHRYLQSTKVPSVIRHEGKVKLNMPSHQKTNEAEKVADSSLADLSTISGDVSLHVWKDAKL